MHFVVYLTIVLSGASEVSLSTNNKTHEGTFLQLFRKFQGNGVGFWTDCCKLQRFEKQIVLVMAISKNTVKIILWTISWFQSFNFFQVMHYSGYPMHLVDSFSINFTSSRGFDGLLKVEMSGCHPGKVQTTVRPYKPTYPGEHLACNYEKNEILCK